MTLTLEAQGVMDYLWQTLDKTEDGDHITYGIHDVDGLWWMGFVDTEQYPLEEWRKIFEQFRQPDDTYLLSHGDFLALDQYRYTGEIRVPFDAMLINEGKYTDEGIHELFDLSIVPSCFCMPEDMKAFIEKIKEEHRAPDGLIKIGKQAKNKIKAFIDDNPSPLRNLELILDQMIEEGADEKIAQELEGDETARATTEAAKQVSQFTSTPTSRTEVQAKRLKDLQKTRAKPKKVAAAKSDKPSTELKKIKRSRKGMRG